MDSPFLYLTDTVRDPDEAQQACLLLIQEQPATEEDAKAILRRVHYRAENADRKQPLQFYTTPTGDTLEPLQDTPAPPLMGIHDAISRLPEAEGELINMRYISGMTIREIAAKKAKSVGATHEALTLALDKLKALLK